MRRAVDGFVWQGKEVCELQQRGDANCAHAAARFSTWRSGPYPDPLSATPPAQLRHHGSRRSDGQRDQADLASARSTLEPTAGRPAKAYCASLSLAGYTDWRLPTRIELITLLTRASLLRSTRSPPEHSVVLLLASPRAHFPPGMRSLWTSRPPIPAPKNPTTALPRALRALS